MDQFDLVEGEGCYRGDLVTKVTECNGFGGSWKDDLQSEKRKRERCQ